MTEMSEKENEPDDAATHTPPGTVSALQETKLQRFKRSLSLKTILRSFLSRPSSEVRALRTSYFAPALSLSAPLRCC